MEKVFADMNLVDLIVFLDDILVHGKTLEELEEKTVEALKRLRKYGIKLDAKKCVFGASEVKHLGFVISQEGIRPDPEKVKALEEWPAPRTVRDVKAFLGYTGFFRKMVPHFHQIAKPLYDITAGNIPLKSRRGKKKKTEPVLSLSSDITEKWGTLHQRAFETLIEILSTEAVIGIADKTLPFELHCDASGYGLGAVLYQKQNGVTKVIAYASRGLNKTEANYPAHKREFLALKWSVIEKFHDYLIGSKVTVRTDNNPLCYVLKNAKLDAVSHRWLASLSLYDIEIFYKRGIDNVDADVLSRIPAKEASYDEEFKRQKRR